MKASKTIAYQLPYVVEGSGKFPIENLALDESIPRTAADAKAITQSGARRIALAYRGLEQGGPTSELWSSAGWTVVVDEGEEG
jgi:hypothetical protein